MENCSELNLRWFGRYERALDGQSRGLWILGRPDDGLRVHGDVGWLLGRYVSCASWVG